MSNKKQNRGAKPAKQVTAYSQPPADPSVQEAVDGSTRADFAIQFGGSVSLFIPLTAAARAWLDDHCSTCEHQYLGPNLAVEARFLDDLIGYAISDGLIPPAGLISPPEGRAA